MKDPGTPQHHAGSLGRHRPTRARGVAVPPTDPPTDPPTGRGRLLIELLEVRSFLSAAEWADAPAPPAAFFTPGPQPAVGMPITTPWSGPDHGARGTYGKLAVPSGLRAGRGPTGFITLAATSFRADIGADGAPGPMAVPLPGEAGPGTAGGASWDRSTRPAAVSAVHHRAVARGELVVLAIASPAVVVTSGSAMAPVSVLTGVAFTGSWTKDVAGVVAPAGGSGPIGHTALPLVESPRPWRGYLPPVRKLVSDAVRFMDVPGAPVGQVPPVVVGQPPLTSPVLVRGPAGPVTDGPPAAAPEPAPSSDERTTARPAVAGSPRRPDAVPTRGEHAVGAVPSAAELLVGPASAGTCSTDRLAAGGARAGGRQPLSAPASVSGRWSAALLATGERLAHATAATTYGEIGGGILAATAGRAPAAAVTTACQLTTGATLTAVGDLADLSLAAAPFAFDVVGGLGMDGDWSPARLFVPGSLLGLSPWHVPASTAAGGAGGSEWAWKATAVVSFAAAYVGYTYCQAAARIHEEAEKAAGAGDAEPVAHTPSGRPRRFVRARVVA